MSRSALVVLSILVIFNLFGTSYLIFRQDAPRQLESGIKLTDAQLIELDKLFNVASAIRTEVENIAGRASYPTDQKREQASTYLEDYALAFERARIAYDGVRADRTVPAAMKFIDACWGSGWGTYPAEDSKYQFGTYDNATGTTIPYSNVSLGKLETLRNEFRILTLSLVKEFK